MSLSAAASSVVGAWTLDEASGTRVDQVNTYDLTDNNTVGSASGKHSNAADFESGSSEYLLAGSNHADLDGGDVDVMLSCWVMLESKISSMGIMTKYGDTGGGGSRNRCYRLGYDATADRFFFELGQQSDDGSATATANNHGAVSTATWYLLHAWHDAANNLVGISVNAGTANTAAGPTGGIRTASQSFCIGATQTGGPPGASFGGHFDGLIDDAIWMRNRFLDATERTEHYNSGTGVPFEDWSGGGTEAVASSAGATTTSFIGAALGAGAASSAGATSTSVVGAALSAGVFASAGVSTLAATGQSTAASVFTSAGAASVAGFAVYVAAAVGSSAGATTAAFYSLTVDATPGPRRVDYPRQIYTPAFRRVSRRT